MSSEATAPREESEGWFHRSPWQWSLLPMGVSLILSLCSVGSKPHWQDSAIYLVAVKEFSVLYPPGFVLYLTLCKAWTLLLGFVDFTLAVHLFSSVCAALAAGFLARAAERLSGDRVAAAVIGCLAAAGYTWWFSGLYAKGYALYFMLVALLLWRMTVRDHVRVMLLIGLAWAAHPSAGLLGPAVLLYLLRHRAEVLALGWRRLALAVPGAVLCAIGPSLLLPLIAARESIVSMGHPASFEEWFRYLVGSRFTTIPGVWGFDGPRFARMGLLFWEEFLGIGAVLAAAGVARIVRDRREERWMMPAWILPVAVVAGLFKIEGQYDFWLVVAWMPLWLAAAVGLSALRTRLARAPVAALAAGLLWSVAANGRDLQLRSDDLPETFGRSFLQNLEPGATLVVSSDDAMGLCRYVQTIRGFRPDVRILFLGMINPSPGLRWYPERLARAWPEFSPPDFNFVMLRASEFSRNALSQAAILQTRRPGAPPVYFDTEPAAPLIGSGSVVPAGFLWKWTEEPDARPDRKAWDYPVTLEQAAQRRGRRRGIIVTFRSDGLEVSAQPYEDRMVHHLAHARRTMGDLLQREGTREGYARSALAYESILKAAPELGGASNILYPLALDYYMLDRYDAAAPLFKQVADGDAGPMTKAGALFYLGDLHARARRRDEAREYYRRALEVAPADLPLRDEIRKRLQ
jgi:hypothetical protein